MDVIKTGIIAIRMIVKVFGIFNTPTIALFEKSYPACSTDYGRFKGRE